MRMRVSIFTPKAFSIRSAMVPERSEWPFRKVESVGRDTPSTVAAAETLRFRGSITSVLMNVPGWVEHTHGLFPSSGSPQNQWQHFLDEPLS